MVVLTSKVLSYVSVVSIVDNPAIARLSSSSFGDSSLQYMQIDGYDGPMPITIALH